MDLENTLTQNIVNDSIAAVAAVAAVIAIIVAVWLYRKQKNKKELSWKLISMAPVVNVKQAVADRIKVYLDGHEITEAQLAIFLLRNTGNVAVKREDYDEPIAVTFPMRKVLDGNILRTEPKDLFKSEDLKTYLTCDSSSVTLAKQLLNPKEEIQFSILLEGSEVEPMIRARIVDGILTVNKEKNSNYRVIFPLFMLSMVCALISLILSNSSKNNIIVITASTIFTVIGATLSIVATVMFFISSRK